MRSGRRSPAATAFLLLLSTLVALGAAEGTVRLAGLAPQAKVLWVSNDRTVYRRSENPILGYELKPDYRNDAADLNESYPRTNAHGQRDIERAVDPAAGVRRVVLLGDSIVEGHGVREIDDTLSRQLDALLGSETEVLNFGVSGYSTRSEVELLKTKALRFDPDLVVLVFTKNDFDNFNREAFQLGAVVERPAWVKQLFSHSALFRMASVRLNWFQFRADVDPLGRNRSAMGNNNVVDGLRLLRELSLEHEFATLVAIWPDFTDKSIVDNFYMPDGSDELVIERLASTVGIPSYRLSKHFREDRADLGPINPRQHYTQGDGMHPSILGTRVGARALREILAGFSEEAYWTHLREAQPVEDPRAIALARSLGTSAPDYSAVENNQGVSAFAAGNLAAAERSFRRALELNPNYADAYNNLGLVLAERGRFGDAADAYRHAVRINPNFPGAFNNLGLALGQQGQLDSAELQFRQALRIDPRYAEAYNNLGVALEGLGRLDEAVHQYREALEIDENYLDGRFNLASALLRQQKIEPARLEYERVVALEPGNADAHANLGALLEYAGRPEEAARHYREALRANPEQEAARANLTRLEQGPGENATP